MALLPTWQQQPIMKREMGSVRNRVRNGGMWSSLPLTLINTALYFSCHVYLKKRIRTLSHGSLHDTMLPDILFLFFHGSIVDLTHFLPCIYEKSHYFPGQVKRLVIRNLSMSLQRWIIVPCISRRIIVPQVEPTWQSKCQDTQNQDYRVHYQRVPCKSC